MTLAQPLSPQAPHGLLWLREVKDRRPGIELGRLDYLNASYESDQLFDVPIGTVLGSAILGECTQSGLFREATGLTKADYILDVEILHLYSRLDRNLLSLVPIIPNIRVDARMELRLRLTDLDGRPFLDKRVHQSDKRWVAGLTATESLSRAMLQDLLRQILEEWIPLADQAIPAFWNRITEDGPSNASESRAFMLSPLASLLQ